MGLDMYLRGKKNRVHDYKNHDLNEEEDGFEIKSIEVELGYWRKHPDLHGYIVREFAAGKDNCQPIDLGPDELLKIIQAVEADALPKTTGFFFGESDETRKNETLDILRDALTWLIAEDSANVYRTAYYEASW